MFRTLPRPLSLPMLSRHVPAVAPVPAGAPRPFWSVMIPTYNSAGLLRRTLASVLAQDPGPGRMQIQVVDNCSTADDPEAVVRELGRGRVEFFRHPSNLGLIRNFNACLERSRGEWVHLLHSDDLVMPGCYAACEQAIAAFPECLMVVSPVINIDENDRPLGRAPAEAPGGKPAVLEDFVVRQTVTQGWQFAGAFVRRGTYERLGGYCTALGHAVDWDMWFRVGLAGPVVALPRAFAMYRIHSSSDTSRRQVDGSNVAETVEMIQVNLRRFREHTGAPHPEERAWRTRLAEDAELAAWKFDRVGCMEGRFNQARWAWKIEPTLARSRLYLTSWVRAALRRKQGKA